MGLFPKATLPLELGLPMGPYSNVYYVDAANGDDDNTGKSPYKPLKTLTEAEDKCTTNQHDVVAIISGASGINLTETLTWDKSYTHLVGLCAPTMVGQRARIFGHEDNDDVTPLINITGSGCVFKNLYAFNGIDDAGCLINVQVTGDRNYFENVHFAGGGHASNAIDGGASLKLDAAYECTFRGCTIGVDTVAAATGMAGVIVDTQSGRNIFEDCNFTMYAGHAGAKFVEIADNDGFDRYLIFKNCLFINDATGYTMTEAFTVPADMGSETHRIILHGCAFCGIGDIEDNDRGIVYTTSGTFTAGGNAAIMAAVAAT